MYININRGATNNLGSKLRWNLNRAILEKSMTGKLKVIMKFKVANWWLPCRF